MDFPDLASDEIGEGKHESSALEAQEGISCHGIVKDKILENDLAG
jgi:hypothetical protein